MAARAENIRESSLLREDTQHISTLPLQQTDVYAL
jgi:hypothetical protein